ncbi:hypothetical protein HDU91_006325, partial [Kappamyces sp. JEL0680]
MHTLHLTLGGLTCKVGSFLLSRQSCVQSVEAALFLLPGIEKVEIENLTECTVWFDDSLLEPQDIIGAIEDAGFDAAAVPTARGTAAKKVHVSIQGMTCNSCVNSITNALSSVAGVKKVYIDLATESGVVDIDTAVCAPQTVVNTIEDAGFDAQVTDGAPTAAAPSASKQGSRTPTPMSPVKLAREKRNSDVTLENTKTIAVEIHGMSCSACVNAIEKHMLAQPGVFHCSVSLTMERATIDFDPDTYSDDAVAAMIDDIGFEARVVNESDTNTVELRILGMTCASCSGSIERTVSAIPGVVSCSVSVLNQTGRFELTKKLVGTRDIVEAIESLGFNAYLEDYSQTTQLESLARTKEIQKWRGAFWKSLLLALPVSFIAMVMPMVAPAAIKATLLVPGLTVGHTIMFLFTAPIQFGVGMHFHKKAYKSVLHGTYTMDVLISLGTNLAFAFSILSIANSILRGGTPAPQVFFETSSSLVTFVALGRYMENSAKAKTSNALSKLISLAPAHALLLEKGSDGKLEARKIPA